MSLSKWSSNSPNCGRERARLRHRRMAETIRRIDESGEISRVSTRGAAASLSTAVSVASIKVLPIALRDHRRRRHRPTPCPEGEQPFRVRSRDRRRADVLRSLQDLLYWLAGGAGPPVPPLRGI